MFPRATAPELMDDPAVDPAELDRSLRDLRAVNQWLGATRVVIRHLDAMLRTGPVEVCRILDVATGSADIPIEIVKWARTRELRIEIVATDLHLRTTAVARERTSGIPEIRIEQADVLDLPYPDHSFDIALCSTALHHFGTGDAVRVLRELDRVATRGVIVNDLRRSCLALAGARLLAATVWRRNAVTRHDGPLSVRQAFTAEELRHLARTAGLGSVRVTTHPAFRIALVINREGDRVRA